MGLLRGTPDLTRKDKKVLGRTSNVTPIEVVAAQGSRIRDNNGRRYIDFQLGWGVGNLGWNLPDVVARVRSFEGPHYVGPGMLYQPWVELADELVELAPGKLAKAWRCVGGTEAVEIALQLAVAATGRHKFISIEGAYHGNSFATRSLGEPMPAHLQGCKHLAPPLDVKALDRLATLLKGNEIAAFILEPIITNLNVLLPDTAFMQGIVDLCHEHGTLVIADEVACGFGRTGTLFASEAFELEPDILCLGKGITNGIAPLAATLCTNDVAKAAADNDYDVYSTYGWHPMAVEAALGVLQHWREHKSELLRNVVERSAEIRHALSIMDWGKEPELRIQGLAIGIGLDDEEQVSRIAKRCREHGLLIFPEDDSLVMFPPLNLDEETQQEALAILEQAMLDR